MAIYAVAYCVGISLSLLAVIYVGTDGRRRNDPEVAKMRCIRILFLSLSTPFFVYMVYDPSVYPSMTPFHHILGLRWEGLLAAVTLPVALTLLFFLGPIVQQYILDGYYRLMLEPRFWIVNLQDPLWIRDHICAPFVEEICFRSCVLPLLFPHLGELGAAIAGPLVFGLCHVHHVRERVQNMDLKTALLMTAFQFSYTTLFGIYASYIFLRTAHLVPCVLVHSFCNLMGVPQTPNKPWLWVVFLAGIVGWAYFASTVFDPALYENNIYKLNLHQVVAEIVSEENEENEITLL